jgi:hypothetical protein
MRPNEIDFHDLLQRLQGNPLGGLGTDALAVRTPEGFFVPPRFTVMEDVRESPIVLLSARGAAGKTTVANELSRTLDAPVWRLQDDSGVSKASVHSTLVQHLNTVDPLSALDSLDSPLLIIDSLDEARARVSATSWTEFVEALLDASKHGLRLLLLGRVRTLEDLWVALVDGNTQPAWYEVSHFDTAGQVSYVDHRAEFRDNRTDTSGISYGEARDAILSALRAPMLDTEADRFVGYPPVLDAVAERLVDNPNYIATANEFSTLRDASRTSVLKRIIEELLLREQTKLSPVARDLSLDPATAYTPEEQAAWLLHDLESAPKPEVLHDCTPQQRHEYYERVASFREDHPFRNDRSWASPVFQAYIVAEEFDRAPQASILETGRTSGLLFELLCGDEAEELLLDETQFASLHASLLTGQWQSADASVSIGSDGNRFEGQFETSADGNVRSVPFLLSTSSEQSIALQGPLTNLTVDVDRGIVVPADGADVLLGPDLHLKGETVLIEGNRAVFARRDEEQGAMEVDIQAHSELSLPPAIVAPLPRKGSVEVIPPAGIHLAYPWIEYQEQAPPSLPGIDERAVRFLDKLMNLTRTHGHKGDRAVFIKKLEGRQPLPTREFRAALQCLVSHGVIYIESEMVFVSHSWETHRYNGKSVPGQRSLDDVMHVWRPILEEITEAISS